ncbi:phenylacetate--CoA ligase family protein [Pedosphaera parvula]|uniref:Coenzyme F390 synthetase (FtsA-2) n=1 Tax=Pedosphaera parvula (strain Ellin514) TaxID=320771 RepID=B9XPY7_PEDPL|nr:AMP-binding protein [Pedosphaera parvula]EEF58084.1 coenzyme F390 synthetase (FtsA-2) [Pedosphaera parvula Ellin514]
MADGPHPSRAAIESSQLEQLRSLVAELFPGNAFYTEKYSAVSITFDIASLEDFSQRFPFTTKQELVANQQKHPPFGTNLTYPLSRYTRFHQTSGTSGTPLRCLDTQENWENMLESWIEVYRAAGVTNEDRIYFAFSFGPFIGFWMAFEAGTRLGALCIPGGSMSSAARIRAILDNGATVLCCTPTYAIRLAEVAAEEKMDLRQSKIKTIIVAGEPGGSIPATRARVAELWPGARMFDHHGMTEVGPVTYECPVHPCSLHIIESAYYAEFIDPPTGQPVAPGQVGELVLTTLARTGSPLLRYRTGDLVKRPLSTSSCACGRNELLLEGGILGRTDDMIVVRGVNVYPSAVEAIIRNCKSISEYRVQISHSQALAEMHIQVEFYPDSKDSAALVASLEKNFETDLALRVPITAVPAGSLPRFEMKAKRWVSIQ